MTEAAWLACQDPPKMLAYLRGKVSERKWRLFACACVRRLWDTLKDTRYRAGVEVAELHADGAASEYELRAALGDIWNARYASREDVTLAPKAVTYAVEACTCLPPWGDAQRAAESASALAREFAEEKPQSRLLRCIVGNPFRPTTISPAALAWQGGTVIRMARAIYEERRWEDMPLLGDALEDAGCGNQAVLVHCRGPGLHTRGCFVVDAILGRS